uniref:Uncharacterized protein n=1 Tax=Lactuca sativa TaxID=4236 RepID=A0A9R1W854_LACSA|nr:hypothetical protein LSAT_V11C300117160 [Lactuca sativa]
MTTRQGVEQHVKGKLLVEVHIELFESFQVSLHFLHISAHKFQLSNEDVVGVSQLYMLKQGFWVNTRDSQLLMNLWNSFLIYMSLTGTPWGKLIWDFTYKQLCIVLDKTEDHLNPNLARIYNRHTYTLHGFVYAFKICTFCLIRIWIFETSPNSCIAGSTIPGAIPREIAYPRMRRLHAPDYERILDVINVSTLVHLIIYKLI